MQTLAFFTISPMGGATTSVAEPVARVVELIRQSGIEHDLGPMGTTLLGDYDEVMAVIKQCHELLHADYPRVTSLVKIDIKRSGFEGGVRGKVARVEALMEDA